VWRRFGVYRIRSNTALCFLARGAVLFFEDIDESRVERRVDFKSQ
jgi:hypothetical protein